MGHGWSMILIASWVELQDESESILGGGDVGDSST